MYRLRAATEPDLPTLVLHRRGMWTEIIATEPKFAEIQTKDLDAADVRYAAWLRSKWAEAALVGVLAEDEGGRPVASGCLWLREEVPRPTRVQGHLPYLLSIYTDPAHRRRGL